MEQARRMAAAGRNYVLVVRPVREEASTTGGVWVFYNNPRPFCYTYMIPGNWVAAREPNAYRSKDGRAFAGLLFWLPQLLKDVEGATLLEQARTLITREYEKALGQRLPNVELLPFESARPGTWKWVAGPLTQGDRLIELPTKIIVDLSPDAVMQITVQGTPDDDGLARPIVESLKTTSDPECYWQLLENMLKIATGNR
ncbi:hypothetical protein [Pelomicrobium sp.]|jgi:hypothetical protein|uniref:hypothetical protein n=1 Tax=Pelomicrobium sp. TaxID=2815319 RepID=UPI002FDD24D0